MTVSSLEDLETLIETTDVECKAAQGKDGAGELPESLWESYSAMANTAGGEIFLGIEETKDHRFICRIIKNTQKVEKAFWDGVRSRKKVSADIMSADEVEVLELECRAIVLEHFGLGDLDMDSVNAYRNRFSAAKPDSPWFDLPIEDFLTQIGALGKDRQTGREGLRIAGLLMFGKYSAIKEQFPYYMVDYQERPEPKTELRWIDRVVPDDTWSGNLYDFYQKVIRKLTADLKIPFRLEDANRIDDTPIHQALREALTNTLIHAGSGIPSILKSWRSQHWRAPLLYENREYEQTLLELRASSLVSEASVDNLRRQFGDRFQHLQELQRIALITAETEGSVSHGRLKSLCAEHPSDISAALAGLVKDGFLEIQGETRAAVYFLPGARPPKPFTQDSQSSSPDLGRILDSTLSSWGYKHMPGKLSADKMKELIIALCRQRWLTLNELCPLLARDPKALQDQYLTEMLAKRLLALRYPDQKMHPQQAYGAFHEQ
jgi:ATP-dependent DNA helicase RecG